MFTVVMVSSKRGLTDQGQPVCSFSSLEEADRYIASVSNMLEDGEYFEIETE